MDPIEDPRFVYIRLVTDEPEQHAFNMIRAGRSFVCEPSGRRPGEWRFITQEPRKGEHHPTAVTTA